EEKTFHIDRCIAFGVLRENAGVSLKSSLKVIFNAHSALMWQRLNMPQTFHYHFYPKINKNEL
ncbi:hypothetical protein OQO70_000635, partial [Citrobacter freundii]